MDTSFYNLRLRRLINFFETDDVSRKLSLGNSLLSTFMILLVVFLYLYFTKKDGAYLIAAITNLIFMIFIKINMP